KGSELAKLGFPGTEWMLITVICICLFIGAMGKSAQFPLHVWLPDSMEGPTPISALIHAATMVTAGIFMVARMSPLFELSDTALSVVLVIGAITALFMGFLGIIQNDIKRVVAYSTLSQLPGSGFAYFAVVAGVFVTAFYSFRMYFLVFHGDERFRHKPAPPEDDDPHHDAHGDEHHDPHETPWVVTVPLVLLAIPSVVIGVMTIGPMIYGDFFKDSIVVDLERHPALEEMAREFQGALAMGLHGLASLPFLLAA